MTLLYQNTLRSKEKVNKKVFLVIKDFRQKSLSKKILKKMLGSRKNYVIIKSLRIINEFCIELRGN